MSSDEFAASGEAIESTVPATLTPSALDRKILQHFPGLVVRKDLTNGLKQNAVVPTYVLEYLLGQHCATDDPAAIAAGLESVQRILAKHYVHRNQAELVKSTIKEKGRHKVIDKLTVELNDKGGFYEAEFTNLGLKKVPVSDDFVRRFPKLLVGDVDAVVGRVGRAAAVTAITETTAVTNLSADAVRGDERAVHLRIRPLQRTAAGNRRQFRCFSRRSNESSGCRH